jgi:hypothetical protein
MPQPIWTYLTALLYFTKVSTCLAILVGASWRGGRQCVDGLHRATRAGTN